MQSLQERVDLLKQDFVAGEKDEAVFQQAYSNTLKFVQLVYTEESAQFIGIRDAINDYSSGGNKAESRLALKDNCYGVLNILTFSK
ncbi:MAG: hypothetical protein IPN76_24325 [Saprospiraceae bacterium]|jgi:hypothetical protein|nr:hypothetical protein [Saprospiraceae bacterium]